MTAADQAAEGRLVEVLLLDGGAAQLAIIIPGRPYISPYLLQPPTRTFTEPDALAWMELMLPTLVAVQKTAMELGMYEKVWQLAEATWGLFNRRGRYTSWSAMYRLGLQAARTSRHPAAEARMHIGLAQLYMAVLDPVKAAYEARSALRLSIEAGAKLGEATALESLGVASLATGNHEDAWVQFTAARKIHEELDRPRGVALMTRHQGEAALAAGRIGEARELLTEALRYFATVAPEQYMHGRVLLFLARVHVAEDNLEGAEVALNTVLEISSTLGTLREQSSALSVLAEIADLQGNASLAKVRREAAAKLDAVLTEERRALTGILGR